jgi:hypothetical protein
VQATLEVKRESLRHSLVSILVNDNRLREPEQRQFDQKYVVIVAAA